MKKQFTTFLITITFLIFGVFVLANQVYAETEVSGNITSDTIWTLANSPYVVTGTVQIFQGSKLTIEPGVIVKFNQNTGLNIDGELYAVGTADNLIVFTSINTSPNKGDWNGVKFFSNAIGASFNNSEYMGGNIIKYSKIEYGGKSDYSGNISTSGGGPLFVSDSIIINSAHYGIYIDSTSNSKIIRNHIENNGGASIWSGGITWLACHDITIKQNSIINNSIGVLAGNLINSDIISYNNIYNNSIYNFKFITPQSLKNYNVQYNYWGLIDKAIIDSKIYDYYDDITLSKVIYEPYGLAELKFDGADTFSQSPICTSWIYSEWSLCPSSGQQTRSIISSFPSGCAGGSPALTQNCTYVPPVCTSWTYSDWFACQSNSTKTRTVISSSPNGCSGGNPVLTQSCTYTPPVCTSWTYSNWSACVNSQQTRTITSSQPTNCAGGNPILNQSCNSTSICTEDNWTSILTPINCPNNDQQTRKWARMGQCQGGVFHPAEEIISCNYQAYTCTSFVYSDWGACNTSGVRLRLVLSSSPSDCIGGNPVLSQNCNYNSGESLSEDSVIEIKDNLSVSTKNQNSQNVKEPQANQTQNESTQIENNEQKVNQEKNTTGSQMAEQRRSEVASAVQGILQVAERDGGIGQQVKIIAQTQVQNQEKLEAVLQKVQNRSGFAKFFVGPNYSEINNAKKLLEQNREQIKQLSQVKNQLVNQDDQQKLTEQIQLFEQSNQEIENSLNTSQKGFSLFGWMFKLFVK